MRRLFITFTAALALLSVNAIAQQTGATEQQLLQEVNQERKAHGLPMLKSDEALSDAARKHAQRMAEQGTTAHQFPGEPNQLSRARAAGAHFSWLSENVDEGPNATSIHQGFMKSPLHRANILDKDMNAVGIGVAERHGQMFAVEDFAKEQ